MKNFKKVASLLALVQALTLGASLASCKKNVDSESGLDIYVANFGYGYEWVDDQIEAFKQLDWVKEKYPELTVSVRHNSERSYAMTEITSGATTFDLLFACESASAYIAKTNGSDLNYFENLSGVYDSEVPNEGVKVKDKMNDSIYNFQGIVLDETVGKEYYTMPWVNGCMGLMYNKTIIKQVMGESYVMPRTTSELVSLAETLDANDKTVFISSSSSGYWMQMFLTWWSQYEGDNYLNYWQGLNEYGEQNSSILSQAGRLRGLQTLESLIHKELGYNHELVSGMDFTTAQTNFLNGEGVIMPNGDWLENEMRSNAEYLDAYDITFMQMPVISSIVEKLSIWEEGAITDPVTQGYNTLSADKKSAYDNKLSLIVAEVDKGSDLETARTNTGIATLTANDLQLVEKARKTIYSVEGHDVVVPAYAKGKEIAKDFLRYLATDEAINLFMKTTGGVSSPYEYDVKTKDATLYESFSLIQKEKIRMVENGYMLTPFTGYRLYYYGGLTPFVATSSVEVAFTADYSADRKSAYNIYKDDIDYYTKNNGLEWNNLLNRAGL